MQRSQNSLSLVIPRVRTVTYGEKSITALASTVHCNLWNMLPRYTKDIRDIDNFKSMLKTYLFKQEYQDF